MKSQLLTSLAQRFLGFTTTAVAYPVDHAVSSADADAKDLAGAGMLEGLGPEGEVNASAEIFNDELSWADEPKWCPLYPEVSMDGDFGSDTEPFVDDCVEGATVGPKMREASVITADGSERRAFIMHENLLRDVIQRQAGSIAKAVLEGVMNLIEADATRGAITITADRIVISDDGRGFQSRQEVLEAFEVFGKSDERRTIAGRWAEFQMGRGQLMAFGKTTYRTRTFEMTTNIAAANEIGVGYELRQELHDVPGCTVTVELYNELPEHEIADVIKEVGRVVRYVDVPVEVNGTVVTVDPATEKWSFEDENAYYKISAVKDTVALYNLGVFVTTTPWLGTGGTIVSKKRLKLNFARNDVISSCPVWKAVLSEFKARTRDALLEKKSPSARDVRLILEEMARGRYQLERIAHVPLLRDSNGRRLSIWDLVSGLARQTEAFSFDHTKSLKADYAMQSRRWLLLDCDFCSEAFEMAPMPRRVDDLGELGMLIASVDAIHPCNGFPEFAPGLRSCQKFVPRDLLYAQLSFSRQVIVDEKLQRDESAVMIALRRENRYIASVCGQAERLLLVGTDDGAEAWTDGKRIVIERSFLRRCLRVPHGLLQMLHVLVHEYTHNGEDLTHGPEFDQRFHHAIMRIAPAQTRILSSLSNVGYHRLLSFRKPSVRAVEVARRLARDDANHRSTAVLPCPGCAAIGKPITHEADGVAFDVLAEAVASVEAFDRAFGRGFEKPNTWRKGQFVQCPVCAHAMHHRVNFEAATRDGVQRACELAVTSAAAGSLQPTEAKKPAQTGRTRDSAAITS